MHGQAAQSEWINVEVCTSPTCLHEIWGHSTVPEFRKCHSLRVHALRPFCEQIDTIKSNKELGRGKGGEPGASKC